MVYDGINVLTTRATSGFTTRFPHQSDKNNLQTMALRTITSQLAAQLDRDLMGPEIGFTLEQLMELAGLSVAQAVLKEFPYSEARKSQVLVLAGPGNNGGDGLVCARHLALFGFQPVVYYPKRTTKTPFYEQLTRQLDFFKIPVLGSDDSWTCLLYTSRCV